MILKNKEVIMSDYRDMKISRSVASIMVILMLQYLLLLLVKDNSVLFISVKLFCKIIVAILFLLSFNTVLSRISRRFVVTYMAFFAVFLLHYIFFPANQLYIIDLFFTFFFIALPCYLYIISINNIDTFMKVVISSCWIIFFIGVTIAILSFLKLVDIGFYNMGFSYYILLPTIVFLNNFFNKHDFSCLIAACILTLIILLMGARGPLLGVLVYFILYQIIDLRIISYKKLLINFVIFIVSMFLIIWYKKLLYILSDMLDSLGLSSRTVLLLLRDGISVSNRDIIYKTVIEEIKLNPLFGVGLAGDRVLLEGMYVHNIFIELFSIFGAVIGLFVSLYIIYLIIRSLFFIDIRLSKIALIWVIAGFYPLLLSSSVLLFFQFWVFIGVSHKIIKGQT